MIAYLSSRVVSGQTIAGAIPRKVRAPQGKSPGNAWERNGESRRVTESATEIKPPMALAGSGKGETVE